MEQLRLADRVPKLHRRRARTKIDEKPGATIYTRNEDKRARNSASKTGCSRGKAEKISSSTNAKRTLSRLSKRVRDFRRVIRSQSKEIFHSTILLFTYLILRHYEEYFLKFGPFYLENFEGLLFLKPQKVLVFESIDYYEIKLHRGPQTNRSIFSIV